jgi:hypothetical protein
MEIAAAYEWCNSAILATIDPGACVDPAHVVPDRAGNCPLSIDPSTLSMPRRSELKSFLVSLFVIVATCVATIAASITYCVISCAIAGSYTGGSRNYKITQASFLCSSGDNNLCGNHSVLLTLYKWDVWTQAYDILVYSNCQDMSLSCGNVSDASFRDISGACVFGTAYSAHVTLFDGTCGHGSQVCTWVSSPFTYSGP